MEISLTFRLPTAEHLQLFVETIFAGYPIKYIVLGK
jgi:hypothetical protein